MVTVANTEQIYIAILGRKNVGKSSLINCLAKRELSIVSETPGTTTDPVNKSVDMLPYGPVVIVDTVGIDDEGELGKNKISRTVKSISKADFAIIVFDARESLDRTETELITYLKKIGVPFLAVVNKIEFGINSHLLTELEALEITHFEISCKEKAGVDVFKKKLIHLLPNQSEPPLISDIVGQGDVVLLVLPGDISALKGKSIKPQIQSIREALDKDTICVVVKDKELRSALTLLKNPPDLVISDCQSIKQVVAEVPENIPLTTLSILMARYKGVLIEFIRGLKRVEELNEGDKVLISEVCNHHQQKDVIETSRIPVWLKLFTKKNFRIDVTHRYDLPENLNEYRLVIHCCECMISRKVIQTRVNQAKLLDIPIVDYGVLFSYINRTLTRALLPFDEALDEWEKVSSSRTISIK